MHSNEDPTQPITYYINHSSPPALLLPRAKSHFPHLDVAGISMLAPLFVRLCISYSLLSVQQLFYLSYITPLSKALLWLPFHSEIRAQILQGQQEPTRSSPTHLPNHTGHLAISQHARSLFLCLLLLPGSFSRYVPPDPCRAHSPTSFRPPVTFPDLSI